MRCTAWCCVVVADGNLLTYLHRAALDTADADTANVLVVVDRRNEHLGRAFGANLRRRNVLEDLLEQRGQVLASTFGDMEAVPARPEQ